MSSLLWFDFWQFYGTIYTRWSGQQLEPLLPVYKRMTVSYSEAIGRGGWPPLVSLWLRRELSARAFA
jgi:hypothetical protein